MESDTIMSVCPSDVSAFKSMLKKDYAYIEQINNRRENDKFFEILSVPPYSYIFWSNKVEHSTKGWKVFISYYVEGKKSPLIYCIAAKNGQEYLTISHDPGSKGSLYKNLNDVLLYLSSFVHGAGTTDKITVDDFHPYIMFNDKTEHSPEYREKIDSFNLWLWDRTMMEALFVKGSLKRLPHPQRDVLLYKTTPITKRASGKERIKFIKKL